jgi:hypothetical protein
MLESLIPSHVHVLVPGTWDHVTWCGRRDGVGVTGDGGWAAWLTCWVSAITT